MSDENSTKSAAPEMSVSMYPQLVPGLTVGNETDPKILFNEYNLSLLTAMQLMIQECISSFMIARFGEAEEGREWTFSSYLQDEVSGIQALTSPNEDGDGKDPILNFSAPLSDFVSWLENEAKAKYGQGLFNVMVGILSYNVAMFTQVPSLKDLLPKSGECGGGCADCSSVDDDNTTGAANDC